jgi:hypothetical protein
MSVPTAGSMHLFHVDEASSGIEESDSRVFTGQNNIA